jgi:cytosine/uracil/thiamine/allantoin permease
VGLVIPALRTLYDYSWFVGFTVAFVTYYGWMKTRGETKPSPREEPG